MAFRLVHGEPPGEGLRRIALERLDQALERLDDLRRAEVSDTGEVIESVHEIRKRAKEVRGLLRLVEPSLGRKQFRRLDRAVRDAGRELSAIRDAQAVASTFEHLRRAGGVAGQSASLDPVSRVQAERAAEASSGAVGQAAAHVDTAQRHLRRVRREVESWRLPADATALAQGLEETYRSGRRALGAVRRHPDDETSHEWRKVVKHLWYQLRLVEPAAPSVLGPLVDRFDDLAEGLGDDHDLATLVVALEHDPDAAGGRVAVEAAQALARERQHDLRERSLSLGARLFAEKPAAFAARVLAYLEIDARFGRERRAGGIGELAGLDEDRAGPERNIERERTFLVTRVPGSIGAGRRIRQGYVAVDGQVSVRVRDIEGADPTLTLKAGAGSTRIELEWTLTRTRFEALWPLAEGRRIDKTRHLVAVGDRAVEVDVFAGDLDGLCLVDVEFDDQVTMTTFEPPSWFGAEVTDDVRWSNARLASDGRPQD